MQLRRTEVNGNRSTEKEDAPVQPCVQDRHRDSCLNGFRPKHLEGEICKQREKVGSLGVESSQHTKRN